jgi:3-hydroxyisobutyrate dehydrogenase-like beta-hydroxyacid dehydrogenase
VTIPLPLYFILLTVFRNFITAALMEIVSEAHVFAEKSGLGTEAMETLIEENYGPLMHTMSKRLTTGAYEPPRRETCMSELSIPTD